MGFLDHVSSVLLLVGLVLMLEVHHSVGADDIIDLQYDRKSEWVLEPTEYLSSSGKLERVLWPESIRFKENGTAPVSSFNTRFRMFLQLGGPSRSQIGYTTSNETNDVEGFTFAMIPMKLDASAGGLGGYLGLLNATSDGDPDAHTFAIEFDFVKNIEFSDPHEGYHFGININSMKSTFSDTLEPSEAHRGFYDNFMLNVGIQYDSSTQTLNVTIGYNIFPHPQCDLYTDPRNWWFYGTEIKYRFLSQNVDLSAVLNEHMYVGFTSSSKKNYSSMFLDAWSLSNSSSGSTSGSDAFSASLPCSRPPSRHVLYTLLGILQIVMMVVAALAVIWSLLHGCYALRQWVERRRWRFHIDPDDLATTEVHEFTYKELAQATKKFDSKQALGRGGFGSVYLGFLPGNREFVAVKRVAAESNQGEREFMAEVMTIGKIRHRNLVRLQGWCHERGELLLVYDLMPNGSLDKLLFGPHNAQAAPSSQPQQVHVESLETVEVKFPWEKRFKAVIDVARALMYLHTECEERIIHRDVKAANVMFDAKFNARLGDFGLARSYNHSLLAPDSTNMAGTFGYLAPELYYTGKQTEQTDVFSYGAFLLEVACGKKPIHHENHETVVLVDLVWKMWGDFNILNAADPNLGGVYSIIELNMVLCLGLLCSHPNPAMRPSMKQVLLVFNGDAPLPQVPLSKPSSGYEIERSFSLGRSSTTNPSL